MDRIAISYEATTASGTSGASRALETIEAGGKTMSVIAALLYDWPCAAAARLAWLAPLLARVTVGWVRLDRLGQAPQHPKGHRLLHRSRHPLSADPSAVRLRERVRLRPLGASRACDSRRVDSADRGDAGRHRQRAVGKRGLRGRFARARRVVVHRDLRLAGDRRARRRVARRAHRPRAEALPVLSL